MRSQFVNEDDGDERDKFPCASLQNLLLVGFEGWFCIPAGSSPYIRRAISCNLFSLEQSRFVDLTVAEHHPDSTLESNVLNFEFCQLLLRRMNAFPRQFCRVA